MGRATDPSVTRRRTPAKCDPPTPLRHRHRLRRDQPPTRRRPGPAARVAERAGLKNLLDERLTVAGRKGVGANAPAKITTVVAGMATGADSIDDLDVLRGGATADVFTGIKAPSTIGSHLRAYTFGHVRQLDAVAWRLLLGLHRCTGLLDALAKAGAVTYVDLDDTVKEMHGYAQQGVAFGTPR